MLALILTVITKDKLILLPVPGSCFQRGLIRNSSGIWCVGFAYKLTTHSAAAAELIGIRGGLQLAWDNGFRSLEVESDAQTVLDLINDEAMMTIHELGAVIKDIKVLLQREWVVEFKHTKRGANMLAHNLANYAYVLEEEHTLFTSVPDHVRESYEQDLKAITTVQDEVIKPQNAEDTNAITSA